MKINQMFDCLVTPLSVSAILNPANILMGTHYAGVRTFQYVYNGFSKLKGCITSEKDLPVDNELTRYSTIELIKYYCTPATLPIIDIIQEKLFKIEGAQTSYLGFNVTHFIESLIINASKLNIEEEGLNKLFCQYDYDEVDFPPKIVNNTIEYYPDRPVFYGFKADECSRKNVFKFLFNGVEELIHEVQNNFTNPSIISNSDEENPHTQLIYMAGGVTAVIILAGIGCLGYKLYKHRTTDPEFQIENNDLEVAMVGVTGEEIIASADFE